MVESNKLQMYFKSKFCGHSDILENEQLLFSRYRIKKPGKPIGSGHLRLKTAIAY